MLVYQKNADSDIRSIKNSPKRSTNKIRTPDKNGKLIQRNNNLAIKLLISGNMSSVFRFSATFKKIWNVHKIFENLKYFKKFMINRKIREKSKNSR